MRPTRVTGAMRALVVFAMAGCGLEGTEIEGRDPLAAAQVDPGTLVVDFVSTAANGVDMNDLGDVIGTSYQDVGCGPFCLPPQDTVVWRDGQRIVLPDLAGFDGYLTVRAIDSAGVVAGFGGFLWTDTEAAIWEPDAYDVFGLGALDVNHASEAIGLDDTGRVVGWSTTLNFPPVAAPFVWTEADGMVDLTTLGFPNEKPLAVSPGGMVATPSYWYHLDDPASVVDVPPAPHGFMVGSYATAINDDGEQARFLVSTSAQNLVYLFRLHPDGTWQQISFVGTGHLTTYGIGSIAADGTVTGTVLGDAVVAWGVDGDAEALSPYLSTAYAGGDITEGGPQNENGEILTELMIGASPRLVRLLPSDPCTTDCVVVSKLTMAARFVQDPQHPGQCIEGLPMHNDARVKATVTDELGVAIRGAIVSGRFLDGYWTDLPVTATTNRKGIATFTTSGPCGVGTMAFLVDDVFVGGKTFDRTTGTLVASKIPQ